MPLRTIHALLFILILWILTTLYFVSTSLMDSERRQQLRRVECSCPTFESSITCSPTEMSSKESKKLIDASRKTPFHPTGVSGVNREGDDPSWGDHRLGVVVPFRDRFEELLEFAPHIHQFLNKQRVRHQILVINQVDSHRFNRAALLNIGFILSKEQGCDYIAMHDVDLLPLNDQLSYAYPEKGPFHVSGPKIHPLYHYEKFVGGILLLTRDQYRKVNGLSNLFWGWGREDDELYIRMMEAGMKVYRPEGITTGLNTFKHLHDKTKRKRDQRSFYNQYKVSRTRDRKTGLHDVQYKIVKKYQTTIEGAPVVIVNVEVECDYARTPFCDAPS